MRGRRKIASFVSKLIDMLNVLSIQNLGSLRRQCHPETWPINGLYHFWCFGIYPRSPP